MRKGSGWSNWEKYSQALNDVVTPLLANGEQFPGRRRMQQLGRQDLLSAAYHHHGGWTTVRRRLGHPLRPKPKRVQPPSSYGKWARSRTNRWDALRKNFPEWIDWGVLPPEPLVIKPFPGLIAYYQRRKGSWHGAGRDFQLEVGHQARRQRKQCLAVLEALAFTRTHRRWPKALECRPWLRHWRYHGYSSWGDCLSSPRLAPRMFDRLRQHWHEHFRWLRQTRSPLLDEHLGIMNRFIIGNIRSR